MPGRRWRARILIASVVVVFATALGGLYACHRLHQTPFMAGSDRLSACGREFSGPGYTYTREQLQQGHAERVDTVMTWQGRREVWGSHVTIGGAPGCGTGVYLRVAENTFRGYNLLGGP